MDKNKDIIFCDGLDDKLRTRFLKSGGLSEFAIPTVEYLQSGKFYQENLADLSDKHREVFIMIVNYYALLLARQDVILDDIKGVMNSMEKSMLAEQSGLADEMLDLIGRFQGLN